ncbi:MAG: HIT family protein [Patescibacteria group bacterium]
MCKEENKWSEWQIGEFQYWKAALNPDQRYLGRFLLMLKRHTEDLLDTTPQEREEFFDILERMKSALKQLFFPDKFNYFSFGNEIPHLHFHIIPRYAGPREFQGVIFQDQRWGKGPLPNEEYVPSLELRDELVKAVKEKSIPFAASSQTRGM